MEDLPPKKKTKKVTEKKDGNININITIENSNGNDNPKFDGDVDGSSIINDGKYNTVGLQREKIENSNTEKKNPGNKDESETPKQLTKDVSTAQSPKKWQIIGLLVGVGIVLLCICISTISVVYKLANSPLLPPVALPTRQKEAIILHIPAGSFLMGSDKFDVNESPPHKVTLSAFRMDQYETSNALYKDCVDAGKCTAPTESGPTTRPNYYGNSAFDNFPVIYVDWKRASIYCAWRGGRLPTEAEWEYAARGPNGFNYPWGNDFDSSRANYRNKTGDTSAVDSYETGKSPFGLYNMAGNVREFVNDWYSDAYYRISISFNPLGPDAGNDHVARGGSWTDGGDNIRAAKRYPIGSNGGAEYANGFRCAYTP